MLGTYLQPYDFIIIIISGRDKFKWVSCQSSHQDQGKALGLKEYLQETYKIIHQRDFHIGNGNRIRINYMILHLYNIFFHWEMICGLTFCDSYEDWEEARHIDTKIQRAGYTYTLLLKTDQINLNRRRN